LYNYDNVKKYSPDLVVLVEGVKKAWKHPSCVASFGKGISTNQLQLLQEWKKIIIMLDGEEETQKKAKELTQALASSRQCVNVDLREHGFTSPDDMTFDQMKNIIEKVQ